MVIAIQGGYAGVVRVIANRDLSVDWSAQWVNLRWLHPRPPWSGRDGQFAKVRMLAESSAALN